MIKPHRKMEVSDETCLLLAMALCLCHKHQTQNLSRVALARSRKRSQLRCVTPLRHLTYRLDLNESPKRRMATALNQLKTEREQVELIEKRTVAALASLLEAGTPTLAEAKEVLNDRVDSAEHLRDETAKAVVANSDFLDDDQRDKSIEMLLTGAIAL